MLRYKRLSIQAYWAAKSTADRLAIINNVSYLAEGEAKVLFDLYTRAYAAVDHNLPCMEIGARYGCSTLALALARETHGGGPIISIDPHLWAGAAGRKLDSLRYLWFNLAGAHLSDHVTPVLALSNNVATWWQSSLGLLWIDGNHSTIAVQKDLENFAHRVVKPGGIICGHDYMEPPRGPDTVKQAVDEYAAEHGLSVQVYNTIWVLS